MEVIAVNADPGFHRSCCGPAPKTKIRRHKCDMTPYSKPCQQSSMCLGFEDVDQSDADFASDSSREFDDLSNFVFSRTSEPTMCHNEPQQSTISRHSLKSMVATPPCHFESMTSTQEILQSTVDHEIKMSTFTSIDAQQQKLQYENFSTECSQRTNGSPMACDNSPTSTTVEAENPKKLEDYKVQDLKNECKKRQLPVSGAKPQLLERLRPYEESILCTMSGGLSRLKGVNKAQKMSADETCNYEMISAPQEVVNTFVKQNPATTTLSITQPSFATNSVLQFNSSQQLVQLVDSTGIIVGVATVQAPSACCCSSQQVETQTNCSTQNDRCIPSVTLRPPTVSFPLSLQSSSPQPTFSFAQHGSGGQFTLAPQESSQTMNNHDQHQIEARPTHHSHPSQNQVMERRASMCCQQTPKPATANLGVRARPRGFTSPMQKTRPAIQSCKFSSTPVVPATQASPAIGDQPGPSPNLPSHTDSNQNSAIGSQNCCTRVPNESEDPPSVPLSAQTFSMHEDMLRVQQKKIEDLQSELTKSQMQLRQQQQAILNAKKAQVKAESGIIDPVQAAYLNKLDIKNLNKYHIQLFLQHKLQLQKLQIQVQDFKTLQTAESRIQEELHIEQAVHDIVRLIKQDSRTALLIVQLLRRYQIERNSAMQSTSSPVHGSDQSASPGVRPLSSDVNTQKSGIQQMEVAHESESDFAIEKPQSCAANCSCPASVRQAPDQLQSEHAVGEKCPMESTKVKEQAEAVNAKKLSNKASAKKRNGIKSIWSRMNSLKALNEKETPRSKPAVDSSNKVSSQSSSAVDMEEIFRTVLEDASKALNDSENTYSDQQPAVTNVASDQNSEQRSELIQATSDESHAPLQENKNAFGDDLSNCSNQQQFLEFAAPTQTFVMENGYAFHAPGFTEENKDTSVYELKDQNVMYLTQQNHVSDNSMETPPPPAVQNSNQASYDHKDFDELMDSLQHDDDGMMYCSATMNSLNNCTYAQDANELWMETDSQQYAKSSACQNQISSDCSYIDVYCGEMGDASGMLPQQMHWNEDMNVSSAQSQPFEC